MNEECPCFTSTLACPALPPVLQRPLSRLRGVCGYTEKTLDVGFFFSS